MPKLTSVATAVPEHALPQAAVREAVVGLLGQEQADLARVLKVFDSAGVERRYIAKPPTWYLEPQGWASRTEAFLDVGLDLLEQVSRQALDRAGLSAADLSGIVFISSTGVSTPSLEARLANRLVAPPGLIRLPVWGLGCAGGVAGLARGADLARAHPDGRFLVVALELCSLAFLRARLDKKLLVATALFGDGAAAAVVEGDATSGRGRALLGAGSHHWRSTERIMGWDVRDDGLDVVFDVSIPSFLRENIGDPVRSFLGERRVDGWALHPGGAKVLEAYQEALQLPDGALVESRAVLRDYGNMSSPTALFVLERLLRRERGPILTGAVGPGFASELALLGPEPA